MFLQINLFHFWHNFIELFGATPHYYIDTVGIQIFAVGI